LYCHSPIRQVLLYSGGYEPGPGDQNVSTIIAAAKYLQTPELLSHWQISIWDSSRQELSPASDQSHAARHHRVEIAESPTLAIVRPVVRQTGGVIAVAVKIA